MPVKTGVPVGVASVMPPVGVLEGVVVGPFVGVVVGVAVGVLVRVFVGVTVGVGVAVAAPVGVLVAVPLGVGVQGGIWTAPRLELDTGEFVPESVPKASISSTKMEVIVALQAGAVSSALPSQVSPGVRYGCSVDTGVPPMLQGTTVGELPWGVLVTTSPMTGLAGSRFRTMNVHVKVAPGVMNPLGQVLVTAIPVVIWAKAADGNTSNRARAGSHPFIGPQGALQRPSVAVVEYVSFDINARENVSDGRPVLLRTLASPSTAVN